MQYLHLGNEEKDRYKICILVPEINKAGIERNYIEPYGVNREEIIVISLHKNTGKGKKTTAAEMKAYLQEELQPVLDDLGVEYLIVGDGDYFKVLTGASKVDAMIGYMLDSKYGPQKLTYVPNFHAMFYDPAKVTEKIRLGINALQAWIQGTYKDPGISIIEFAHYPRELDQIADTLLALLEKPALTCDIEAFSLKHHDAGIGTITFCWNKNQGVAFPVDYIAEEWTDYHGVRYFGRQGFNPEVRKLLKWFFQAYRGTMTYHHIAYDAYVLIYQLFMEHILDNQGLLYGLEVMLPEGRWHDTKLITYLATNSCAGNKLGLKDQAQAFAGNYAQSEIKDIRKIPLPQLLQYNLIDGLSTWYVFEKHYQKMIDDNQLEIYQTIFQPATVDIIQMQLTGMPVSMDRVQEVKALLQADHQDALVRIQGSPLVQEFVYQLNEEWVWKRNQELKKKQVTLADAKESFNPNSPLQLQKLLYGVIGLPVIAYSDTKQPSCSGDTLKALRSHTDNDDVKNLLSGLIDYKSVDKILTSFIPAMENAQRGPDGHYYLFGNFNLGGTVSGRLSSSDPNLQNLPANSKYAKLIKSCFMAPLGWHFCGIDFASLEDRISALTTKDPNKLKVYTDGYDGHAMRAVAYFGDQMLDVDPNSVASVNAIADKEHDFFKRYGYLRQDSKAPTFALTYQGTYKTLMTNCGFSLEKAKMVEERYHALYQVSDAWVAAKLDQACRDGYITAAFGLRVRTPLLAQVVRGTSKTPHEAEAEGRTAGNALGQSWCLLNSRAGSEFMRKVRQSRFRHLIKPCAQIHDAQYFLVADDLEAIQFANTHVVKACQWQDHPEIWHDEVKLGGEFGIFYPDWSQEVTLPNGATAEEILTIFSAHYQKVHG